MTQVFHGIDIVEIARIERMLCDHGQHFLNRVYTQREQEYARTGGAVGAQRLAVRFAAKEAVFKAIGTGLRAGMNWTDIEVVVNAAGAPSLMLTGRPAQIAQDAGIERWAVSLTHSGGMAVASVIGIGADRPR